MADKREIQKKNHPKKGSRITVDPIRDQKDISTIRKLLADRPTDFAFFIIGINTGLRASDILGLRVGQFSDVRPGDFISG